MGAQTHQLWGLEASGTRAGHRQRAIEGGWSSPHVPYVTANCAMDPPPSLAMLRHPTARGTGLCRLLVPTAQCLAPGRGEPEPRCWVAGEEGLAAQP